MTRRRLGDTKGKASEGLRKAIEIVSECLGNVSEEIGRVSKGRTMAERTWQVPGR
jgi:hypothetical protein